MKYTLSNLALICSLVYSFPSFSANISPSVSDFALLDHQGKFHQLSYFGDQQAVVILAQSSMAPYTQAQIRAFQGLTERFVDQDVVFYLLNGTGEGDRGTLVKAAKSQGISLPILMDETQLVTAGLGLSHIGQIVLINPRGRHVTFRGTIDQLPEVEAALVAMTSQQTGQPRPVPDTQHKPSGPAITFADPGQATYGADIVPILKTHCVTCHRDGGIAPWAMSSHTMVQGWSAMMREVLLTRRMPPGQTDPHVGKEIEDAAGLSTAELQTLVHWIDRGAPADAGQTDPLTQLTFSTARFSLGEPDMTFKVPAQEIPATGVIDYRYIPVELNLDKDVWVRAMEFVPGDRQVLHHVIAYVSSPADKSVRGRETGAARGESVGGFAPGRQPDEFRDNSGRLLTKGSNLLLQMHYTTSGKATVDETEIGLYLYDEPPAYVMSGGVAGQRRFLVPPHAKEYRLQGEQLIERDAYLYEMNPHMHFRGKYMNYTAEYPDGTREILLSVPKYNFNWQFNYRLKEPLFLPAGTRLIAKGAMDNSAQNPSNPDPSKPVHFGLQTKHEMFFGFTTLRYVGDTPQRISRANAKTHSASSGR